jgi:mono/diheme cytochrome c family protein
MIKRPTTWISPVTGLRRSLLHLVTALLAAIAEVASAQAQGTPEVQQPQTPADSPVLSNEVIEAGRGIFHGPGTCHACHGDDLQGGPIAPSLRGPKWRHIDGSFAAMLQRIRQGKDGTLMVGDPGGISDAEAVQVATYVWAVSQGKAKP